MESLQASRRSLNFITFVLTCGVLVLTSSEFTVNINKISDDLNKALGDALQLDGPNYTDLYENFTYFSSKNAFNPKGFAGLYNITTKVMGYIMSKDVYPEGLLKVEGSKLRLGSLKEQWQSIALHYGIVLGVIIVLVLFGVLMPVCGVCFCCCRCCGNCGARSKPFDKKGDLCRKICLASLLICFGTAMLFGVVCAFVSNQHIQNGTDELPENLRTAVRDTDTYLASASSQINVLLNTNYHEFEDLLFNTLDKCSNIVLDQLREYSKATALTEVMRIVNGLNDTKDNLTFMKYVTNDLRTNASELNDGLRKVKRDLLQILNECSQFNECSEMSDKYISQLGTDIDFNNLPDISEEINQLSTVLNSNITATVREGQQAFENIRLEINKTISSQIPKVKKSVVKAGKQILAGGKNVTTVLQKIRDALFNYTDQPLNDGKKYLKEYSQYRYYLDHGVSCVLLLITICITLGLICGICGKRPDAYSDDCCNKGTGSRFLMIGVAIMFLCSIILTAVTIIHFSVGLLTQRLVCDSLRSPNDSQVVNVVDRVVNLREAVGVDVNISWALRSCHHNLSAYKVFRLESQFDLADVTNYVDKFEINKTLNDLTNQINANTNVVILSAEAKRQLQELVASGIAEISYDKFTDELARNLTSVDLGFLSAKLDEVVKTIQEKGESSIPNVAERLRYSSHELKHYQTHFVEPMTQKSKELIVVAQHLKESLKFGKNSFAHAIQDLIQELEAAQTYLRLNGSVTMTEIAYNFGQGIEKQVKGYLNRVVYNIKNGIGKCGPMSNVLNATLIGSCDKILLPWNGFWFSIVWCLILFIPTIVLSVKLATLYQKYEPYPGPLVEAEYLYDAYADRDNIPLNSSVSDKRAKKKYKKKTSRYDNRGTYVADNSGDRAGSRETPGASHYQDARYADMAPKHWAEFPVGGPPQYQRAPTEYERPPPYYYPGTEQQ